MKRWINSSIDPVQVIAGERTFYQAKKYSGCAQVIPVQAPVYTATHVFLRDEHFVGARFVEINWEGQSDKSYRREGAVGKEKRDAFSYWYVTTRTREFPSSVYRDRGTERRLLYLTIMIRISRYARLMAQNAK